MEFGLREWAILIGFVAIGLVLWDGFRRSRGNDRYKLPFNMGPNKRGRDSDQTAMPESDPLTQPEMRQRELFGEELVDVETTKHTDLEVDLGFDDDGLSSPRVKDPSAPVYEPDLGDLEKTEPYQPAAAATPTPVESAEPSFVETVPGEGISKPRIKKVTSAAPAATEETKIGDVVTVFVIPKNGGVFKGVELRNALVAMGLSIGDRDLYHRHTGNGRDVLYSVADASESGTFPQGAMEGFTSRGLILLIELQGHTDPEHGFEEMISSARQMSRRLKADVLDSRQQPLQLDFINEAKVQVKAYARKLRQGGLVG